MLTIDATNKRLNQPLIWSLPSRMNAAGHHFLNRSLRCGKSRHVHDVVPASIHTSSMSGILFCFPPQLHVTSTASIHGLCSSSGTFFAFFFSSCTEPKIECLPHLPHFHIGNGVPQ